MDTVATSLQPEYSKYFRIGVITILAFTCVIVLGVVALNSNKIIGAKKDTSLAKENTALVSHANGMLQALTDRQSVRVGDIITLTIVGDSDNKSVMGYDVVLRYPSSVSYVGVKSLISDFDIFETKEAESIIVTGAKKLEVATDTLLQNTPMLELQFKAEAPDKASFTFDMRPDDRTDSNMFSVQNVDLLGSVKNASIEIQ